MATRGTGEVVCPGVWIVGGAQLSDPSDCLVYAVDLGGTVLIDCGAGPGWEAIRRNLISVSIDPASVNTLVLTHCHIDHIGAATQVKIESGCRIIAHDQDTEAIETGDPVKTAAHWYNLKLAEVDVDHRVMGHEDTVNFPKGSLRLIHTPGHTPGSMVALTELDGKRILFGQDIHGPFDPAFGSDVDAWRRSMKALIDLEADILCEGHYGVFQPAESVKKFIQRHLSMNAR